MIVEPEDLIERGFILIDFHLNTYSKDSLSGSKYLEVSLEDGKIEYIFISGNGKSYEISNTDCRTLEDLDILIKIFCN